MTWLSGSCYTPPPGVGKAHVSTDAYSEPVVIEDVDVRADDAEVERERVVLDETHGWPRVERGLFEP